MSMSEEEYRQQAEALLARLRRTATLDRGRSGLAGKPPLARV